MEEEYYQIDEVARRTGLTKRAIRHYEEKGLIEPERTEAQYRLYTDADVDKISRIKSYKQSLGFTLTEVKEVFDLEGTIKDILSGDVQSPTETKEAVFAIKNQIKLIEKKEESMKKVKQRYVEILEELEKKNKQK